MVISSPSESEYSHTHTLIHARTHVHTYTDRSTHARGGVIGYAQTVWTVELLCPIAMEPIRRLLFLSKIYKVPQAPHLQTAIQNCIR